MKKYSIDDASYQWFNRMRRWVIPLDNGMYLTHKTREGLARAIVARNAKVSKIVAENNAEVDFREEVIRGLVDMGYALHVAVNKTSNPSTLVEVAKEAGVI